MTVTLAGGFYNLATPSERHQTVAAANAQTEREIRALWGTGLDFLGMVECVGHTFPVLAGATLIRDTSRGSRANIAAYIRTPRAKVGRIQWTDLSKRWARTEHAGMHDPRSYLSLTGLGVRWTVAHQAPLTHKHDTGPARTEGFSALERIMAKPGVGKGKPRVLVMDANAQPDQFLGSKHLAHSIGGHAFGRGIDCGVARGGRITEARYVTHVGAVQLKSDHQDALLFRFAL